MWIATTGQGYTGDHEPAKVGGEAASAEPIRTMAAAAHAVVIQVFFDGLRHVAPDTEISIFWRSPSLRLSMYNGDLELLRPRGQAISGSLEAPLYGISTLTFISYMGINT